VAVAAGTTGADGTDGGPLPTAFVAKTVNVQAVPSVSPVTVAVVPEELTVAPPGVAVTV
jgi:hypothetical protein